MKRIVCLCILYLVPIIGYNEELIIPIKEETEIKWDMDEVMRFGERIEVCDLAWKNGLLQQARACCSQLEEKTTNPLFLSGIFLRKGLIADELGLRQESDYYLLSFMKSIHKQEMDKIPQENRREFEQRIIRVGRSQADKLREHIFSLYEKNSPK